MALAVFAVVFARLADRFGWLITTVVSWAAVLVVDAALLVLAVTTASGALGPRWTGLLAPFPVATSVVVGFVHAQQGAAATVRTLSGVLLGLFSFAVFCLFVAVFVERMGGVAFLVAAAVTVVVQLVVVRVRRWWWGKGVAGRW
ncbi:hypothetical protein SUDANB95_02052 [Actinosynnema sp. ALI-1.44]